MGTRNLTCVVKGGQFVVAQYGQWDGYPEGLGANILAFLRTEGNVTELIRGLEFVRFADMEGADKDWVDLYNANCPNTIFEEDENGNATLKRLEDRRTEQQINWYKDFMSRDVGGEILMAIASLDAETAQNKYGFSGKVPLVDSRQFAADSLFCEWAYVVDLDEGRFEVFTGFNKTRPLESLDRFFFLQQPDGGKVDDHYPVYLAASFDLQELPDEESFIKTVTECVGILFPDEDEETSEQSPALLAGEE